MADGVGHVPVPRAVTAMYVVVSDSDRLSGEPAPPVPPASLLTARGTSARDASRVEASPYARAVTRQAAPQDALANERAALSTALSLAEETDGLVVDSRVPRVVRSTPPSRACAADWVVLEHAGQSIETHGLARFGVPELGCTQVPADRVAMYDAVLVGVAQRIVEEWPGNDPIGPATITVRDIARGYDDAGSDGPDPTLARGLAVTISLDDQAPLLAVTLHDDPAATLFRA